MLKAVAFQPEEATCVLMTTVGALTTTVASNQAHTARQIALLTQLVQQPLVVPESWAPCAVASVQGWFPCMRQVTGLLPVV